MKKIALWISLLILLWLWIFIWSKYNYSLDLVSANPDYICKKAVTNSPCKVTNYPSSCSEWSSAWTRTCPWVKTTEVSYYLIRTSCESWYTQVPRWSANWNSWRQGGDYVSASANCTITEEDHVAPAWRIN